mgnify:CR=1 FL=1
MYNEGMREVLERRKEKIMLSKRRLATIILAMMTILATVIPVFAGEDAIGYSFNLKSGYGKSYSAGRYRETTDPLNQWKVRMTYHSRGTDKKATFWLARTGDKAVVSGKDTIGVSNINRYYIAYAGAAKATVSLGCENGANTTATVSGYWDEEIGKHYDFGRSLAE